MDSLAKKDNLKAVRKALPHLPRGLDDTYDEAMQRVPLHKHDPEARFRFAEILAIFDRPERALEFLSLALDEGYRCHNSLLNHHCWDSFRSDGRFQSILKRAADMSRYARTVFLDNGGDRLLGVHVDAKLPEIESAR